MATSASRAATPTTSEYTFITLAGSAGNIGTNDGVGSAARFYRPAAIAVDSARNLFVADVYNHTIRKVAPDGLVTTVPGFNLNGIGQSGRLPAP
jgi:hypothetical protein